MVATREHPVQIPAVVEAEAKGAAYRSWLGLEGDGDRLDAIIETSKGDLRCTLDVTNAPMTIMSFVGLARGEVAVDGAAGRPFYDGTIFHRVIPDFMIQGGDPEGSGRGGPGFRFDDEPAPRGSFDRPGLMAMANAGPNTNGSQFFVTEVPTPHLSGKHTIFGACDDDSVRLVERIARVKTNDTGRPTEDVVIEHIRFEVVPR
ncbi:MAG: peptidylprolyl isomerase [Alphaproteobacteria bacterium]|nr:peptidylprolyl isomerase [Alphaproteobacteria bacterium]MCB9692077.1 peptidylprolyl isomerase [Alphaproteobacteria bacterium]